MIPYGNLRLTGIKKGDITPEIDNIINSAGEFILICGYNFPSHKTSTSTLYKIINSPIKTKHCILPIRLQYQGGKDVNRPLAIQLVKNGVSVSIEDLNHSKWIMTEKSIYYGSANFTKLSLTQRIEVASFRDFIPNDTLLREFANFSYGSMKQMLIRSDRRRLWGILGINDNLIINAKSLIKKYNPSIEKVEQTIESIDEARAQIIELLENCYWYLENDDYDKLSYSAQRHLNMINSINRSGFEILELNDNTPKFRKLLKYYNSKCDEYTNSVSNYSRLATDFLLSMKIVPDFTKENRKLAGKNLSEINLSIDRNIQSSQKKF